MMDAPITKVGMTLAEFIRLSDREVPFELIDGEIRRILYQRR
jgi:hypothetical protein